MPFTDEQQVQNIELLDITNRICGEMDLPFSANEANQSLADIRPGSEFEYDRWSILETIGTRVGIKFHLVKSTVRELLLATREPSPIVFELNGENNTNKGQLALIIRRRSRGRYLVYFDGKERTVSSKWIKKCIAQQTSGQYAWKLAQPMFPAADASAYSYESGAKAKPQTPLKRYLAFLKPEAADIRSVFIFSVFVGILSLTTPLAVEALVNTIAFGRYLQPLLVLSLIVFVFLAFRAGIAVLMTIVVEVIQRRIFVRVVDDVAMRLTRVPLSFWETHNGPELVNRFFDVVQVQKVSAKLLLDTLMLFLQTIIGLTVLAFYHPFLLGYDIGLMLMMAVVLFIIGRGAIKTAKKESYLKYETAAWLQEIARNPTTFKFNGGLGFALNRADELAGKYVQTRREHFRILIRQVGFSMMMQAVAATVLLGLGGYLVIEGQMTLGQLVAAELIVTVILGSFAKIGKDLESFYDLMASVDKLGKLFDLPGQSANQLQMTRYEGPSNIELVDLKHRTGAKSIRANISQGSTVAISGPSGCGKSALIETMAGLHTPSDGYALVNDFRVDLIAPPSLQSQLAFINNIEIFEGSIEENIRLGRSEIDSASLNKIFSRLGLQETITSMDKGYKTELSTTGFPLSTTQAIRLVLARALISRPPTLLIDNLLDRLSDEDLENVLDQLNQFASSTTIVIATGRRRIMEWAEQQIQL